jgi:hypothetical protein
MTVPSSGTAETLSTATNAATAIIPPIYNVMIYAEVYLKGAAGGIGKTYEVYSTAYANGATSNIVVGTGLIAASGDHITFCDTASAADFNYNTGANVHSWGVRKTGLDNVTQMRVWGRFRQANELEIKAYNAGWRP